MESSSSLVICVLQLHCQFHRDMIADGFDVKLTDLHDSIICSPASLQGIISFLNALKHRDYIFKCAFMSLVQKKIVVEIGSITIVERVKESPIEWEQGCIPILNLHVVTRRRSQRVCMKVSIKISHDNSGLPVIRSGVQRFS